MRSSLPSSHLVMSDSVARIPIKTKQVRFMSGKQKQRRNERRAQEKTCNCCFNL
ncbi:hypothetical protein Bca4012_095826 [Brassica carinata]